MASDGATKLRKRIRQIAEEAGVEALALAFADYETRTEWALDGDRLFHAASTIKVPVLAGVFGAISRGELTPDSRVHVRNRFLSVADGKPFRIQAGRDANSVVYQHLGRTMKVDELAYHMIVTSSNLATNLLVDLIGVEALQGSIAALGVGGIELRRGVEDERAYEEGINNRVSAKGLLQLLRHIEEGTAFSVEASARMLEILHEQQFRKGIPAGVPDDARVANKTGEISTIAHDAGIVYLRDRKPYALVVLTQWKPEGSGRSPLIAAISRAVYTHLSDEAADA